MNKHYRRFYAAYGRLPYSGDKAELKKTLVLEHTDNRSEHLSDMTEDEYDSLCRNIEAKVKLTEAAETYRKNLKKKRRTVLVLLKEYGVNTEDWSDIDRFCEQATISGKKFAQLTIPELDSLNRKMRSIISKKYNH